MGVMKTPGVYIVEKNAFPNSVVEVATAVPAFVGYTERADNEGKTLLNKPWRITSMSEFRKYYGGASKQIFSISKITAAKAEVKAAALVPAVPAVVDADGAITTPEVPEVPAVDAAAATKRDPEFIEAAYSAANTEYYMTKAEKQHTLYYNMMMFFQNGGGPCYIVSVGNYGEKANKTELMGGIKPLIKEMEPTMVVVPEAVLLTEDNCIGLQQSMLSHCGSKMRNRVAILDVFDGYKPPVECIKSFRSKLGINFLDFASAYYPWLNTSIVQDSDVSYENIDVVEDLKSLLTAQLNYDYSDVATPDPNDPKDDDETNQRLLDKKEEIQEEINKLGTLTANDDDDASTKADKQAKRVELNKTLTAVCPIYKKVVGEMKEQLNLMPPSAAMAGVYTMVDNSRGVWKAPANVSLNAVIQPSVNISSDDQEDLNVTAQGKSINAIRAFVGEGTLVWGARTLDGNSLDWRYISVRRTMIMLEESIRLAAKAYVFEPNTANTWTTVNSMVTNFLTGIWKRGGLAGASPSDAFSVSVGLGNTMSGEDILEGIMRVTVLVAITRPAEFIEITFQQQMQKS
jgi:phage tail sheath protein FI